MHIFITNMAKFENCYSRGVRGVVISTIAAWKLFIGIETVIRESCNIRRSEIRERVVAQGESDKRSCTARERDIL